MPSLKDLVKEIEDFAPPVLAEPWDNVGLQVGDFKQDVGKILLCLDVSVDVLEQARANKCQMVISHHPILFKSPAKIIAGSKYYNILKAAFENKISIYSAHTNLDKAQNGINSVLAGSLRLSNIKPLVPDTSFYKLVFFAEPKDSLSILKELSKAGTGIIGKYSNTSFRTKGTGTFKPEAGAHPAVGEKGVVNEVIEERVETIVHRSALKRVVDALLSAHPYEEAAYDIYPLEAVNKSHVGLGSIGDLSEEVTLEELSFGLEGQTKSEIRIVGDKEARIKRVAILAGSGAKYIDHAKSEQADVFVSADVKYHEAQLALDLGLNLLVMSHFAMEKFALRLMQPLLNAELKKAGYSIDIVNAKESDI